MTNAEMHWGRRSPWAQPHSGIPIHLSTAAFQQTARVLETLVEIEVAAGPDLPWRYYQEYSAVMREEGEHD